MENYFRELSQKIFTSLQASETLLINYQGEDSDFSRFNNNKIRQAGFVRQQNLKLDLILHNRQNSASLQLSGDIETDLSQCKTQFQQKIEFARQTLPLLAQKPKIIAPGRYRVFLTPSALNELLHLLSWGGFGLKSHRTSQTPLLKMLKEGLT